MSERWLRIGSIYGSRFFNRQTFRKYGLPKEERIHQTRWPIVSGDTVQVIEGPEAGKTGQVLFVKRKTNQIVVKDVNINVRTQKRSPFRAGYFYRTESPIHYTNVQLIDPVHAKPCKIRFGKDASGENVRFSTMSGAVIPKQRRDFVRKDKSKKMNKVMDTHPDDVWKVTFKPFERNWKPAWTYGNHGKKTPQQSALKGKERVYRNFENEFMHTPIAHV